MTRSIFLVAFLTAGPAVDAAIQFHDATKESGISFVHTDGSYGAHHIVETVASGLALIDYDGDGDLDIYFLNGKPLGASPPHKATTGNALYRNDGNGVFTDVTAGAGVALNAYSLGCAVADFDNDGDEDIFVTNFGPHVLLTNNGDGTFSDTTARAGLDSAWPGKGAVGAGCAFLDFDRDGHLDLYVGNYLRFDPETDKDCARLNVPVYCDPRTYPPAPDKLFRNNGDGTFEDVTEKAGIAKYVSYAMGVVCSDFDADGWTDIFVGNDVKANYLFHNQRDGTFKEIGAFAGVAYDLYGDEQGTMGVSVGDYDADGRFDILVTTYQHQLTTLYRNLGVQPGGLQFEDVTLKTGIGTGNLPLVQWGCGWADFDNNGVPEVFLGSGHLQDRVEEYDQTTTFKQRNQLFQLNGSRYVDISARAGTGLQLKESTRGVVFGDLNSDGRLDVVLSNARAKPSVLINQSPGAGHWITLKLIGAKSNRSAVGAVVRLTTGGRTQIDEIRAGSSYQSANDLRLHFGLGQNSSVDNLEIRWPGGLVEEWAKLPVDRVTQFREGQGKVKKQIQ